MMNWAAASQIAFGHPYQSKPLSYNHCLSGLSATRVTTMWLKQPTCFCRDIYHSLAKECPWAGPPVASKSNPDGTQDSDIED